ncbi:outer membrane protein [Rhodocyclus purpureus]|uniref:outer membrane protein n=1 Tax=Rhodocyclus purpureus TaxID=1067 RepID=UPI001911EBC8|nr:outer membrane beta-barrel protein [Rhodocyclus purpureus]MBK5914182.1 hypothetical protein [Rhodocyclus purpureus]
MKFKKLAMLAALSAASSFAVAAPAAFDGPFVQAGVGFANSQSDYSETWNGNSLSTKLNDTSFVGQVAGGWSQSFGQWNLAASAYYTIGDQKAGKVTFNGDSAEFKLKDTWGVSIDPGYYINPQTLAYLKLGYVATKGELSATGAGSDSETFNGYTYGVGLKYAFTPNLYGVAEIQQANFESKSATDGADRVSLKPNSLTGIIGVGYKF